MPQVSTSLNSAQSVFPICHQTQAPILENYLAPLTPPFPMPMSTSMYPNLPYMQPCFHRVQTPSLCVPHFSANTALPLLHSESIETSTKNVNSNEETSANNETAAILVSMHGTCGDDQENDSNDDLLSLK